MIPRKIHYCWFGSKPFPKIVKKCMETWKIHFPGYEFVLWNEKNAPMNSVYVKEAYAHKKFAFMSDYVRFWALYNEGGIYLDTDMFIVKAMDDLLNNTCYFAWENSENKVISCGVIGCEKGNLFIKEILDEYNNLHFKISAMETLKIPRVVTYVYKRKVNWNDICIFPFDYFYPFPYEKRNQLSKFTQFATENTYGIHLWNLSWISTFDKFLSKVVKIIKKH